MKKYLTALLIVVCACFLTLGLAACVPDGLEAHSWSDEWSSTSTKHWRRCTDAGCNGRTDYADHEWELTTTYEAPTCGETGLGQFTCTVCGATMGNESTPATVPATGEHEWELVSTDVEPTCGEEGSGSYVCEVCLDYAVFPIPATGAHDYSGNYVITAEGHYHKCLNGCGFDEELELHVVGEGIRTEPSGNKNGKIEYRCEKCNYLIDTEVIPSREALYSFDVVFVKNGTRVIPYVGADGELHVALMTSSNASGGYSLSFTGYNIDGGEASVTDVSLYYYNENTMQKSIIDAQHGPDATTSYMGYLELVGNFYVTRDIVNVPLLIESAPVGGEAVSVLIYVTSGTVRTSSAVNTVVPVFDVAPVYYLDKKNNY